MRRFILFFLISCVAFSQASAKVTLGFPGEEAALVGIYIKDLNSGKVLAENDSRKVLLPASVMKAITAASAISLLDKNFRFVTDIYLTGEINEGVCYGNLVVKSVGDPTIDSDLFKDSKGICQEIADNLKASGITAIKGNIIVRQNLTQSGCIPEWEIADVAWGYGAGLFGFNYKDNVCRLWPASKRTSPYVPDLKVTTIRDKEEDLVRGVFSDHIYAFSPDPENLKWSVGTTMPSPAAVFSYELEKTLSSQGIEVGGNKIEGLLPETKVCSHQSPILDEMLRQTVVHSHNLFAEGILRAIAPLASRKDAIKKELDLWYSRGIDTRYMKICDGSGLARADRISAMFVANVLEWMATNGLGRRYASLFPVTGKEGTVKNFLKSTRLEGKLALKTGSMSAVQCYAGYKLDQKGRPTHVVVILVNGFYCDRSTLRKSITKFLLNTI